MTGDRRSPADVDAVAHVFVDALDDRCVVSGADGHHLQRVRRLRPGEVVTAADGSGVWREYVVADADAGMLTLDARAGGVMEAAPPCTVAVALPPTKGGLDAVVAAVTELGVTRVTPIRTARTVVRWDPAKAVHVRERLRTVAREAAMQCRRARIPDVDDFVQLAVVADRPDVVVADRTGAPARDLDLPASGMWTVVVGPEGGLAPEEHSLLAWRPRLAVGNYVLRAVTAPVAAVAVLTDRIGR